MRPVALACCLILILPATAAPQKSFEEGKRLREYLASEHTGWFVKLDPVRAESELEETLGTIFYEEDGAWYEKKGCFRWTEKPPEFTRGSYGWQTYVVWDRGWWPPQAPPMSARVLGSEVSFTPGTGETLKRLELQVAIPEAVTYRRDRRSFRAAARELSEECREALQRKNSHVVFEVIAGREAYVYRRYTSVSIYPVENVGPMGFLEVKPGQYQREIPVILAYRALRPVWKKTREGWSLRDLRPVRLPR